MCNRGNQLHKRLIRLASRGCIGKADIDAAQRAWMEHKKVCAKCAGVKGG